MAGSLSAPGPPHLDSLRGHDSLRGQTEFQVNLKLGLTPYPPHTPRIPPARVSRVALDLRLPTCRRQYPGGPLGLDRSWDGLFQPFPCTQRRRPSPYTCKVGDHIGLFEACSTFTGDYGLSARRVAKATRLSRRLRRFRYLHRRSDSYRLERPSCRVGIAPTEDQHLTRFTAHRYGVPGTPELFKTFSLRHTSCVPVSSPHGNYYHILLLYWSACILNSLAYISSLYIRSL